MKTEIVTDSDSPNRVQLNGVKSIVMSHNSDVIVFLPAEAIELRDFLNQLNLDKK